MYIDDIAKLIESKLTWKRVPKYPAFLNKYKWVPSLLFTEPKSKHYIAVDIIFHQNIPKKIYEREVARALKDKPSLRFCLFSADFEFDILKKYCSENKFGLKIYSKESINTIFPFRDEIVEKIIRKKTKEGGWFPQVVIAEAKKVNRIHFANIIVEFASKLEKSHKKEDQFKLIRTYINKILSANPNYVGSDIPFLNLAYFENLIKSSKIECNDHVFHSARVFLIGCIVIDKYYDFFVGSYKEILGIDKVNVEYIWLLTSLFHDIGRIKQDGLRIILPDSKDDDSQIKEAFEGPLNKNWRKENYKNALANIVDLIKQSNKRNKDRDKPWVGYALGGKVDPKIANILKDNYNKLKSHGVISCFDLSTDLLSKLEAAKIRSSKSFLLYHLFPAVTAIAFHDWKIWKDLSEQKIFPIGIKNYPIAALLIFIDTWDDYKRGNEQKITIDKISATASEFTVYLTWHKQNEYLDERLKYDSFQRHVLFSQLRLKIEVSNKKIG